MVIEGGLSPKYVLDEMQMYEIQPLINNIYRKSKESWEQTRFISYLIAQVNSTKQLTVEDIMEFPWDSKESISKNNRGISNEDVERLRRKAQNILNRNKK